MNSATKPHPSAGHGNGSVRTHHQPAWSSCVVVAPELLVLEELLVADDADRPDAPGSFTPAQ